MSTAKYGVPEHLRGNPGDCLAIRELAMNSGLSAYGLALHSFVIKGMLSFDGQAVHAIVERNAPLKQRLRYFFQGEDDEMTCTVVGSFRGEETSVEYESPPVGKIQPKNSPLWQTDVKQQLAYLSVRRWAKRYCPDILLGVVSRDELEDSDLRDVSPQTSPNLLERLPGRMAGAGFKPSEHVTDEEIAEEIKTEPKSPARAATEKAVDEPSENPAPPQQPVEDKPAWEAPMAEATVQTSPPPPPARPQTAGEYQAYAMAWIEKHTDPDEIEARWEGQMDMRRDLKVPLPMRKQLEAAVKARVNTLRGK
jgi:hypothetical protein